MSTFHFQLQVCLNMFDVLGHITRRKVKTFGSNYTLVINIQSYFQNSFKACTSESFIRHRLYPTM